MVNLLSYQQKVLDDTAACSRVAYFLDMGLGKTFVGSEKMMQLGSKVNLLVCQKSKVNDWRDHMVTNYAMNHCYLIYDLTKKNEFAWFTTALSDETDDKIVGIINYELLFRRKELGGLSQFTLMLDESSMIQNESAKRSKFVLKMNPDHVILLSGTPTAGKYENLYSQIKLLGWKITKNLYWKHFIETQWVEETDGFFRKEIIGYKNVERLKQKLRDHGAIFMKSEEVIDLPEQVFTKTMVESTKEYRKFMKSRIIQIEGKELIGDYALTKRLYARMLCGHFNQNKLEAFKDMMDSTEDRVIVFYNFTEELQRLIPLVENRSISIMNGSTKDLTAYEAQSDSVTFIQYQAGSMGLNLQKANKVIYFTLPQSSELFEQSKKRVHRIGQDQRCFYYYMICSGSVEEDVLKTLEMRKDYTDELFAVYEQKIHV